MKNKIVAQLIEDQPAEALKRVESSYDTVSNELTLYARIDLPNSYAQTQTFQDLKTVDILISRDTNGSLVLGTNRLKINDFVLERISDSLLSVNGNLQITGNLVLTGDLNIHGTVNTYNQDILSIGDSWLNLGTAAETNIDGGIRIYGAASALLSTLKYQVSDNRWKLDKGLDITGTLTATGYNPANWDTAYTHSQNNNQAHSDYLKNNADDTTSGILTAKAFRTAAATTDFTLITRSGGNAALYTQIGDATGVIATFGYGSTTAGNATAALTLTNALATIYTNATIIGTLLKTNSTRVLNGTINHYYNLASYYIGNANQTGTLKITMPNSWSSTMITVKIRGYNYSASSHWEIIFSGYNYATDGAWHNINVNVIGNPPSNSVRAAHDGTKCVLLIGTTSTIWGYGSIEVYEMSSYYTSAETWATGWSISKITDETGITAISTPIQNNKFWGDITIMGDLDIEKSDGTPQLRLSRDGSHYSTFYTDSAGGTIFNTVGGGSGYIIFDIDSSEKMRILSNGNVGIGKTPTASLHVYHASNAQIAIIESGGNAGWMTFNKTGVIKGYIGYSGANGMFTGIAADALGIRAENNLSLGGGGNNLKMTINATGVGIGGAPYHLLNVSKTATGILSSFGTDADNRLTIYQNITTGSRAIYNMTSGAISTLMLGSNTEANAITIDGSTGLVKIGGDMRTPGYASQLTSWSLTNAGDLDVRYIFTDELRAKAFTADVAQALAGSTFLTKSVSKLSATYTIPATGASSQMIVDDLEGLEGIACFTNGDYIRLRVFNRSGGGLVIADVWGTVALDTSYGTNGFLNNTQAYTFTCTDDGGVSTKSVFKGSVVLDYGATGDGFIENTVLDEAGAPYTRVVTWATNPSNKANYTLKLQLGDLAGITDINAGLSGSQGHVFGLYADNVHLKGHIYSQSGNIGGWTINAESITKNNIILNAAAGNIAAGTNAATATVTGTNVGTVIDNAGGFLSYGNASNYIRRSETTLEIKSGTFNLTGGTTLYIDTTKIALGTSASGLTVAGTSAGTVIDNAGGFLSYGDASNYIRRSGTTLVIKSGTFNLTGGTTLYIDTTKVALGTSASGLTVAGTNVGTVIDNAGGFLSYGDANNYIRRSGASLDIKSATFNLVAIAGSSIKLGTTPTATSTTAGVYIDSAGLFNAAVNSTNYLRLTASGVDIKSTTFSLAATNLSIVSGAANSANITVGSGATAAGLNAASITVTDIAFWAGSTFANRATAPFRVAIDGKIAATAGTIAGWDITDKRLRKGTGLTNATTLTLANENIGSGTIYTHAQELAGFSVTWNNTGNGGHIVVGQMASTYNTLKTGYYGIQMMDEASNEYFALGALITGTTKTIYNKIAGWSFNNNSIYKDNTLPIGSPGIEINSTSKYFAVFKTDVDYVKMHYTGDTNWGIEAMYADDIVFRLGSINQIAGWDFTNSRLRKGTGAASALTLTMATVNIGSGTIYTHAQELAGYSLTWNNTGNGGHIVVGQMAATYNTLKTGYYGIQMMDEASNEYFALGARITGTKDIYNKIAGFTFDSSALYTDFVKISAQGVTVSNNGYTYAGIVFKNTISGANEEVGYMRFNYNGGYGSLKIENTHTTFRHIDIKASGDINIIKGSTYNVNISTLPTSSTGLSTGDLFTQTATQLGGSGTTKVICIV